MSSRSHRRDSRLLFSDLPLRAEPKSRPTSAPAPKREPLEEPEPLTLFPDEEEPGKREHGSPPESSDLEHPAWQPAPSLRARVEAGLTDLVAVVLVLLVTSVGLWWIGLDLRPALLVPLLLFLVPFSFLFEVFPLAFWGRTPGMARVGLVARNFDGRSLSFSQAALRWLAALLTVVTLGLPLMLIVATGQSLADRLSQSEVSFSR